MGGLIGGLAGFGILKTKEIPMTSAFRDDTEYFDQECGWLKVRATRIQVERELREAVFHEETGDDSHSDLKGLRTRRIIIMEKEAEIRRQIDTRLEVHRHDPAFKDLGTDLICSESRLCPPERTLLLGLTASAVGYDFSNEVLGGIDSLFNGITVGDAIQLLNPKCVRDWLQGRAYFYRDSPLVRDGRVVLDDEGKAKDSPKDELMVTEVVAAPQTVELISGHSLTAVAAPAPEIIQ